MFKKIKAVPRRIGVSETESALGEWCVNTVDFINDGNLLLACMHVESLYVLLVPVQPPITAEQLVTGLRSRLLTKLIELETPPNAARRVLDAYESGAILAKTNNRRTVGHMNSILRDMEGILDIPDLQLRDGNKLLGPKIEHRLNNIPRGITGSNATWPLTTFWQCVRNLCPELPARTDLSLMPAHNKEALRQIGDVLYNHLPDHLAGKMYATFQDVDVLYTTNELQTIADTLEEQPSLQEKLPTEQGQYLHRQVRVKLKRLLGQQT